MTSLRSISIGEEDVLDLRWFDTEVARSRRNGRPLTAIVLASASSTPKPKGLLRRKAKPNTDLLRLVQQEARRSDFVLSSTDEAVVVIAPESEPADVELLARRINSIDPDTQVIWGTATFPADGATLGDLVDAAASRVAAPVRAAESV